LNPHRVIRVFWIGTTALTLTYVLNAAILRLLQPFHLSDAVADTCGLMLTIAVIVTLASHVTDRTRLGRFTTRFLARIIFPFD
jgi:hypothetical protein